MVMFLVYTANYYALCMCMYVVFCIDITGVSPSKGSINGGTMITIYGKHFDANANSVKVLVGGKLQITTTCSHLAYAN